MSDDCTRDTDGLVLNEGTFGACEYDTPCAEATTRTRTDRVVPAAWRPTESYLTTAYVTPTDSSSTKAFGACEYDTPCAEATTRTRTDRVCANGVEADRVVSDDCVRDTDGLVLNEGAFGACAFADECQAVGQQTRRDSVCANGISTSMDVQAECRRETEGRVINEGVFGACEFTNDCIETGDQNTE